MSLDGGVGVSLGAVIAKAGEGSILEVVGHPEWVAKVFHRDLGGLAAKVDKVAAMIGVSPPGSVQQDGFVVLTWPVHTLVEGSGVVGYVMPRIDTANAVEIHSISNPSNRVDPLPSAPQWTRGVTWLHLVNIAANLSLAVEAVHRVNAVIGDFQERNILVSDTTQVTLVDCDSMQFTDAGGRQYLCGVGRPEFTAPELASVNLRVRARERSSDLFALAVHVHLLLMAGNHPFMRGAWTGGGDQPDALALARAGAWAGAPGSLLHRHPLAPPVSFLPPDVQRLFVRAFTEGARDPLVRPSAAEWREALLRVQVMTCPRGLHQIPVEADPCPWCAIDDERTTRKRQRESGAGAQADSQKVFKVDSPPSSGGWTNNHSGAGYAPTQTKAASGGRTGLIVVGVLVALVLVGVTTWTAAKSSNGSSTASTRSSYPTSSPSYATYSPVPSTAPQTVVVTQSPARIPQPAAAEVVGTCDEGGSCGVKQRNAPYTAAPRLYSDDLQDGMTVTLVCEVTGDVRSSAGHGASSVWFRLANGAYVNSVYFDAQATGIPAC